MKTCKVCKQEFPATKEYFYVNKQYLNSYCKSCLINYNHEWRKNNKEWSAAYYQKNKERILNNCKNYYINNKEKIRAYKRQWYLNKKSKGLK